MTKLNNEIKESPIHLKTGNTNDLYNDLIYYLQKKIQSSSKTKNIKSKQERKPWFNKTTEKIIKTKNYWYGRMRRNPTDTQTQQEYKIAKNKVVKSIRKDKKNYFSQEFNKAANNTKKVWTCIRTALHNGTPPTKTDYISTLPDPANFIEGLNSFIAEVGTNLAMEHDNLNVFYRRTQTTARFNFEECTKLTIRQAIKGLKNTSSCGHDGIDTKSIKTNIEQLELPIKTFINSSLITGTYPEQLKIIKVTPILKGGNPEEYSNYRPICLLPVMGKILEKIVNIQLLSYLEEQKIIHSRHYGFRNKSNTTTTLFDFITLAQSKLDRKQKVSAIFIDMKKAFETVDRKILLKKIFSYGVKGREYKWFESYFTNRKQFIEHNGQNSTVQPIHTGIPQGTNLSTTLFIMYLNDIAEIKLNGELFLYADDIAILYATKTTQELSKQMNTDCKTLNEWMSSNKLTPNTQKTKYINFNSGETMSIVFNSVKLEEVKTFKYLGVTIDNTLKWKQHIQNIKTKTSTMAGIFRRIATIIPDNLKRQMFFALFHSRLTYGLVVWFATYRSTTMELQTIQNKAIRNLFQHNPRDRIAEMHKAHNIPTLEQFSKYTQILHIYNMKNHHILTNTILITHGQIHSHSTRNANNLCCTSATSTLFGEYNVLRIASKLFNEIPENLKTHKNNREFKEKLKKLLYA